MSISMYQASVPVLVRMLKNLSDLLKKGQAHAEEKGFDDGILVNSRLSPDMLPLVGQIQIATDVAKGCAARLAGETSPSYEDNEKSFEEMLARIEKTIEYLTSFKPEQIDGSEDKTVTIQAKGNTMSFPGMQYLVHFVHPNFYFHITTAYGILRHNGVDLGKMDYLGKP